MSVLWTKNRTLLRRYPRKNNPATNTNEKERYAYEKEKLLECSYERV